MEENFKEEVMQAIWLGLMCFVSYLGCYYARNILSVVSPYMYASTDFTIEFVGTMSTGYMITYAVGQLLNGRIGDLVKGKYLVGGGLFLAGICNVCIPYLSNLTLVMIIYSSSGFFLSMIYAPIMRMVAENTKPVYASRCSLGFTIASFLGVPMASLTALLWAWEQVFWMCGMILILLGILSFVVFQRFERQGIIRYRSGQKKAKASIDLPLLIKRGVIKFTLISMLTGIVRTSVLFWVPTYLSQYLGLSEQIAAVVFAMITLLQSASPFINVLLLYERVLKRDIDRMVLWMFACSTVSFGLMCCVSQPVFNILCLLAALVTSAGASTMLFSVYCPSLKDTGAVSTVTGFLDAVSYMAAAMANLFFSNAINTIGWNRLIWIWSGLMLFGVLVSMSGKIFHYGNETVHYG